MRKADMSNLKGAFAGGDKVPHSIKVRFDALLKDHITVGENLTPITMKYEIPPFLRRWTLLIKIHGRSHRHEEYQYISNFKRLF